MSKTSGLKTSSSPVKNMASLMDVLDSTIVPDVDKYYVFVYKAKTPRIKYDCHPFVVVTGLFRWGFSAYNFHWEESRKKSEGKMAGRGAAAGRARAMFGRDEARENPKRHVPAPTRRSRAFRGENPAHRRRLPC